MPVIINGDTGITQSGEFDSDSSFGFKNRLINGDMRINQRGVTSVAGGSEVYTLDRWIVANYFLSGAISVAQSSDAPAGFTNSLLVTNGTGEALAAADFGSIRQKIEGFNVADLAWGTASAKPITISFWVKSSVTGNYSVGIINSALNRSNRTVFTINSANTWEQKSVQFSGDTSGTWVTNNGIGLYLDVITVAGSNQYAAADTWTSNSLEGVSGASATWVTSTNATFFITGVQLEKGSTATSFDFRDYGRELMMCQRYLPAFNSTGNTFRLPASGVASTSNTVFFTITFPVTTRVPATGMFVSSAAHFAAGVDGLIAASPASAFVFNALSSNNAARAQMTTSTNPFSANQNVQLDAVSASGILYFTGCEL